MEYFFVESNPPHTLTTENILIPSEVEGAVGSGQFFVVPHETVVLEPFIPLEPALTS